MAAISIFNPPIVEKPGDNATWRDLPGSSNALALARLAQAHNRRLLLITADAPSAYRFEQELKFFAQD